MRKTTQSKVTVAHQRIALLRRTGAALRDVARLPVPKVLTSLPQAALESYSASYSRWLKDASRRCIRLANDWERALTKESQEMEMSFSLQYLQLQEALQKESREYLMISNIMKTKHDTVKNSISNIR